MGETFVVGQRVRCKTWYDPDEVGLISAIEQGEAHPYLIVYEDGEYISVGADVLIPADPPPAQPDDEQARAIRERLAKFDRFASTEGDVTTMEMVFSEDVRFLLARLDAVQVEREAAVKRAAQAEAALIPFASVADSFNFHDGSKPLWATYPSLRIEHFRDAVRVVRHLDAKESDDANA